jgi:hypothetical protein
VATPERIASPDRCLLKNLCIRKNKFYHAGLVFAENELSAMLIKSKTQ